MKLINILKENLSELEIIISKPIPMSLLGPDNALVSMHIGDINKDLVWIRADLFLDSTEIRPEVFEELMQGTIHFLNQRGIQTLEEYDRIKIGFESISIYNKPLRLDLFQYLHSNVRMALKRPLSLKDLTEGTQDYKWVSGEHVPRIDPDYLKDQDNLTERAKNIFKAFRRGKINGITYDLTEDYVSLSVLPVTEYFTFEHNTIKPKFRITIFAYDPILPSEYDDNDDVMEDIKSAIQDKFDKMNINIRFD